MKYLHKYENWLGAQCCWLYLIIVNYDYKMLPVICVCMMNQTGKCVLLQTGECVHDESNRKVCATPNRRVCATRA